MSKQLARISSTEDLKLQTSEPFALSKKLQDSI